ncbi:type IV secretion system protein VirB10 [Caulobacter sp. 73W]|uniref:Type IV secretion system protein VirB10 n=1 Tax=Caulobacter sp. 73W TaxID=3161137 RepID=A0AB39KXA4_9CAUL
MLAPWKRSAEPAGAKTSPPKQTVAFEAARSMPTLDDPPADAPALTDDPLAALEESSVATSAVSRPAASPDGSPTRRPAPVLAWSASSRAGDDATRASIEGALSAAGAADANEDGGPDDAFARLKRTSAIGTSKARRLGDRNFLLTAGAAIPCTLQTAMDSSLPGQVSCIVGRDVWSENGAVVLIEKGARVLGEYRQGLKAGEGRLFVLWTRAVTPGGVAIDLGSPAADALGRAGFGGEIDRHFWRRFGGAILLSVVDDAAVATVGRQDGQGMARLPSEAAAIAVDRSVDIPPTLRIPQGSQVSILVAKDLDFSGVYGVSDRGGEGR